MGFFSIDSPLYKFMNRLMEMFILNLIWLVCSIPIVTMGAATTAAYTITLKMVDDKEGYIVGPFWREFKANLKKGSIIGVIMEVAIYAIYIDFQLFQHAEKSNTMFLIVGVIAIFLLFMHMVYAFPLLARYENTIINTLRNSYSIAAKYLGRTAFMAVVLVFEMCVIMWNPVTLFVGLLFGPACIIYTISGFANTFFNLIEQDNAQREEEMEEEADEEEQDFAKAGEDVLKVSDLDDNSEENSEE